MFLSLICSSWKGIFTTLKFRFGKWQDHSLEQLHSTQCHNYIYISAESPSREVSDPDPLPALANLEGRAYEENVLRTSGKGKPWVIRPIANYNRMYQSQWGISQNYIFLTNVMLNLFCHFVVVLCVFLLLYKRGVGVVCLILNFYPVISPNTFVI